MVQNKPWVFKHPGLNPVASFAVCITFGQYLDVAKLQHTKEDFQVLAWWVCSESAFMLLVGKQQCSCYVCASFSTVLVFVFPVATATTLHEKNLKEGRIHCCRKVVAAGGWGTWSPSHPRPGRGERCLTSSLLYTRPRTPAHARVLPTLKAYFPWSQTRNSLTDISRALFI